MLNRAARFLILILAFAATAHAQRVGPLTTTERWRLKIDDSSRFLKSGNHAASLKIAERVIREMIDQLGPGDAATHAFGLVLSHKALALAGLGREADALWYWHTVLTLYPAFAKSDLSAFGKAGAFLASHREPRQPADESAEPREREMDVKAPRLRKRVEPEFPIGALHFGASGVLVVEVVITKEGKITAPRVVQPLPAPTLSYTALEALRKWRFDPGTLDGVPVDTIFNLTVNYKQ